MYRRLLYIFSLLYVLLLLEVTHITMNFTLVRETKTLTYLDQFFLVKEIPMEAEYLIHICKYIYSLIISYQP